MNIPLGRIVSISPSLSSPETHIMAYMREQTQNFYEAGSHLFCQNHLKDATFSLRGSYFQHVGSSLNYQFQACLINHIACAAAAASRGGGRGRGRRQSRLCSVGNRGEISPIYLRRPSGGRGGRVTAAACDDSDTDDDGDDIGDRGKTEPVARRGAVCRSTSSEKVFRQENSTTFILGRFRNDVC